LRSQGLRGKRSMSQEQCQCSEPYYFSSELSSRTFFKYNKEISTCTLQTYVKENFHTRVIKNDKPIDILARTNMKGTVPL
jgi:hypothetical protein